MTSGMFDVWFRAIKDINYFIKVMRITIICICCAEIVSRLQVSGPI